MPTLPATRELAQPPAAPTGRLELLAQMGGVVESVAWSDDLLAAGIGSRLVLLDPLTLEFLGQTEPLPALIRDVVLHDGVAYLAAGDYGLVAVEVADPSNPRILDTFSADDALLNIAPAGDHLLGAFGSAGLQIIDLSDPGDLQAVSVVSPGQPVTTVAYADPLGVIVAGQELLTYDLSDMAAPVQRGETGITGNGRRLLVDGSTVYVAAEQAGVLVIDITLPEAPAVVGTMAPEDGVVGLTMVGDYVVAADYRAGMTVYAPDARASLGNVDTPGVAMAVTAGGGFVYVADYVGGIRQIDASDPAEPVERRAYQTLGWVNSVAVRDGLVAVAGMAGLGLVEVSDPATPVQRPVRFKLAAASNDVELDANRAYVVDPRHGLRIYDLTAAAPVEVGDYQIEGARAVIVHDQVAFLAHEIGLIVLDVSVLPPTRLGSLVREWRAADLLVLGETLYVADPAGAVWCLDVSNPVFVVEVGDWSQPAHGLTLADQVLVAAAGAYGLRTAAIGDRLHPLEMGRWLTYDARAVVTLDTIAFLADAVSGIHVIDLRNPAEPIGVGQVDTLGTALDIAIEGDTLFVADAAGGLLIYAWR